MSYKYVSKNTIRYLNMHDCDCERIFYSLENHNFILNMEWMEVLKNHPNNPYNKSYQSGPGIIELINPSLIECSLIPMNNDEALSYKLLKDVDIKDIEILQFNEEKVDGQYRLNIFGEYNEKSDFLGIKIIINYTESIVMFNKLENVSWFEIR